MRRAPPLVATTRAEEGCHVVELQGVLDISTAEFAEQVIVDAQGSTVIVDLDKLTFLDASGLNALLRARQRLARDGHTLKVRNVRGIARLVMDKTKTISVLVDD